MIKDIELKYENKLDLNSIMKLIPIVNFKEVKNKTSLSWYNKLFFCDNLTALKYLLQLKKDGKLINSDGSNGIKLVYIDPPFATGVDYYNSKDQFAYSSKMEGINFIDFLRKRILLLKELLTDDGSIYVRIDYHYSHYIKIILDEIFNKNNFKNEILVRRTKKTFSNINKFNVLQDSLFFYTKTNKYIFNKLYVDRDKVKWLPALSLNERNNSKRIVFKKELLPKKGYHWTYSQKNIDKMIEEKRIRLKCINCKNIIYTNKKCCDNENLIIEYLQLNRIQLDNNWLDIPGYSFGFNYPTSNSEQLLERVILASSNKNDIVLDCFAGSGTTGVVAEKLNRNWIMCDFGELSINIIKNRLKNLKSNIGNTGAKIDLRPYIFYVINND